MASKEKYSDHDSDMMALAGAALAEASRSNDLDAAVEIYAATPPQFRDDLRDFAIWLVENETLLTQYRRDATLH